MSVASQELFDTKRSGTMNRSDEHHISESPRDELDSAEDERPHEDIAQLTVGLHERKQLFAIDLDHFARLGRSYLCEPAPARQNRCLTGEHSRSKYCNGFLV